MKWHVTQTIITGGLNSMMTAIILSLAIFHLFTNKSTNAPIHPNEDWISLVKNLVPFTAVSVVISLSSIFVSMTKKQLPLATLVLLLYGVSLGGSIYFTLTFAKQLEMKDVGAETLFNTTIAEINAQDTQNWMPGWLDNIQKQSQFCCGVITYRDYKGFWPKNPTKIPRSCCRDIQSFKDPCPSDLTKIPYPNTPDNYLKVETGCMDEINEATRRNIRESFYNSIILNIFIGVGILAFLLTYVLQYFVRSKGLDKRIPQGNEKGNDDDAGPTISQDFNKLNSESGVMVVDSSYQVLGSFNSMRGDLQLPIEQQPAAAPMRPTQPPSVARFNKGNAVFAGLPFQFPEASTGDDMTIGGGNIGRREVYLAQDMMTTLPMPPEPIKQQQPQNIGFSSSVSQDDFGDDVVRLESEPQPPVPQPGDTGRSKEKKKKKKRKQSGPSP